MDCQIANKAWTDFSTSSSYLSRGEQCEKSWCLPSMAGRSIYCKVIQRWQKSLLVKWCVLSFFLQMTRHVLMIGKFVLSHQIAVLFYLTLGDTHAQSDKKIITLFSVIIWFQIEVSFAEPNLDNDAALFATTILLMLVVFHIYSNIQMGKGLVGTV